MKHPPYIQMVSEAMESLQQPRKPVRGRAVLRSISELYPELLSHDRSFKVHVNRALLKMIEDEVIVHVDKLHGLMGAYRLVHKASSASHGGHKRADKSKNLSRKKKVVEATEDAAGTSTKKKEEKKKVSRKPKKLREKRRPEATASTDTDDKENAVPANDPDNVAEKPKKKRRSKKASVSPRLEKEEETDVRGFASA